MRLSNALAQINGGSKPAEKTASVAPTAPSTSTPATSTEAAENLKQALAAVAQPEPETKTASQASPLGDLVKLAADVANTEHEALTKEAQIYGAAVADGFMARLAQYGVAADKLAAAGAVGQQKTASISDADTFEKFAAENPQMVREAHDLGYATTQAELQKLAEAAYAQGHNQTVEAIYKLACDTFVGGFTDTLKLLEAKAI